MARIAEENREVEAVARAIRAEIEGGQYLFVRFPDHIHVLAASGKEYRIEGGFCDCPDAVYRAHPAGILCKHEVALQSALERNEVN